MLRHATLKDVKIIQKLINNFASENQMIGRPLTELYDHLRDFWVFEDDETGKVLGCCALQFCWESLAELRSLAVDKSFHKQGIGRLLVSKIKEEAAEYGMNQLFTLTYQPVFFSKLGFTEIDRKQLPLKIWADCIHCVKFPDCDETAMIHQISGESDSMYKFC
ncbi:MAG: GNAT family N-acetyltransferase [Deltaproteobacteria bacterium]|nr:MAG: GNAT family N-acetyltransferase [Deltaproteobacteria bacterium]